MHGGQAADSAPSGFLRSVPVVGGRPEGMGGRWRPRSNWASASCCRHLSSANNTGGAPPRLAATPRAPRSARPSAPLRARHGVRPRPAPQAARLGPAVPRPALSPARPEAGGTALVMPWVTSYRCLRLAFRRQRLPHPFQAPPAALTSVCMAARATQRGLDAPAMPQRPCWHGAFAGK